MKSTKTAALCMAILFAGLAPGGDALGKDGVIAATGVAKLVTQPDLLRLKIQLVAHAPTITDAMEGVSDLKTAAQAQLDMLAADPDSIEFTPPALTDAKSDQQRQMEMMVMQRMRGSGRKAGEKEDDEKVAVAITLTAEWPLKEKAPESRLVELYELKKKIEAADLGGIANRERTPEEEELMEEAAAMGYMGMGGDEAMTKPGVPSFMAVAKITDQQQLDLLTEAVSKARANAARLARAAGTGLGELESISATGIGFDPTDSGSYSRFYMYQMMANPSQDAAAADDEAVSVQPGPVTYHVTVNASYTLSVAGEEP